MIYKDVKGLKVSENGYSYSITYSGFGNFELKKTDNFGNIEVKKSTSSDEDNDPYNSIYKILDLLKGSYLRINGNDFATIVSYASEYSEVLKEFLECSDSELCLEEILFNFRKFAC